MSWISSWNQQQLDKLQRILFYCYGHCNSSFSKSVLICRKDVQQHYHWCILVSSFSNCASFNSEESLPSSRQCERSPKMQWYHCRKIHCPLPGVGVAPERLTSKAEGMVLIEGRERVSHFLKQGAAYTVLFLSQCLLIGRWEALKKHVLCVKGETEIH